MTVRTRHTTANLAALLLLLSTTAACNNSDATPPPTKPPTTSTSAAPSPSPTSTTTPTTRPSPPAVPPAATSGLTITAAESFARFYLAALDYTRATGDPTLLRKWADRNCVACTTLANKYEKQYKVGGSVTGDNTIKVSKVTKVRVVGDDAAEVVLQARQGRHVNIAKAGATPTVLPGGPVTWRFALIPAGRHWTTYEMARK